jgi:hypothetical protein
MGLKKNIQLNKNRSDTNACFINKCYGDLAVFRDVFCYIAYEHYDIGSSIQAQTPAHNERNQRSTV